MGSVKRSLQDLEAEQKNVELELKVMSQKRRILEQQKKELTRQQRTHRLCSHGGLLEYFLPPDQFSDEQMKAVLKELFRKPETQVLLDRVKSEVVPGVSLD